MSSKPHKYTPAVLDCVCPTCNAQPRGRCKRPNGYLLEYAHGQRVRAAETLPFDDKSEEY